MDIDVSVVMVLEKEGSRPASIQPAVGSVVKAMRIAADQGIVSELVLTVDACDPELQAYVSRCVQMHDVVIRCLPLAYGDMGQVRNEAISRCVGRWITIMAPHQRMGSQWIVEVCSQRMAGEWDRRIFRPEFLVVLGRVCWRQRLIASDAADFPKEALMVNAVYPTGFCCGSKSVFEKIRYPSSKTPDEAEGMDWYFTCETLASGIEHHILRQTVLFVNDPDGNGLENRSIQNQVALLHPSRFFDR